MKYWFAPLALLASFGLVSPALAHSVQTDYAFDNKLELTVTFGSGEPFQEAPVRVYAPGDETKPWMEGTTDAEGQFAFTPDSSIPGEWTVRIGDNYDHGDILKVPVTTEGVDTNLISKTTDDPLHLHVGENIAMGQEGVSVLPEQASAPVQDRLWMLGAIALSGGLGTTLLMSRKLSK